MTRSFSPIYIFQGAVLCVQRLAKVKLKYAYASLLNQLMTEGDRINRMEDHLIDMRLAVSALLETVTQHQHNFETIQRNFQTMQRNFDTVVAEIRDIRIEMQDMRTDMLQMQSEIRGLQTENSRILDILQNRNTEAKTIKENRVRYCVNAPYKLIN